MGFSLSVCRVHRVVEIVNCYPCDHFYIWSIVSLILYRLDYLKNRFIKRAIRSNVLTKRLNLCVLSVSKFYLAV